MYEDGLHGFILSCKNQNNAYAVVTNFLYAYLSVLLGFIDKQQKNYLVTTWKVRHSKQFSIYIYNSYIWW